MLKQRILTAAIGLPILIVAILFLPPLYFALLTALLILLAAWEWTAVIGLARGFQRLVYVVLVLLGLYFVRYMPLTFIFWVALALWLWAGVAIYLYNKERQPAGFHFPEIQSLFGFFALISCWMAMVNVRVGQGIMGPFLLLLGLFIIFAADSGAYFVGGRFGRHPLVSRVSPKKTREGLFAGLLAALLIGFLGSLVLPLSSIQRIEFCLLSIFVGAFSVVGDLTISLMKRQTGLKDSGHILPGHGGLLDRLDSVMSGILVYALGLLLVGI